MPEVKLGDVGKALEEPLARVRSVKDEVKRIIVGQDHMIQSMLIGLLSNGHILLEGVPGLAKTLAIKTLARAMSATFQRIQFTPDLLPSDVTGTMIYNPKDAEFLPRLGPIFANLILADEINRAPAKVQSALLEAMQERQVTIGEKSYPLPDPFLVMATQNPIEHEGTYTLPEAQVDRFMLKIEIDYPDRKEEREIIDRNFDEIVVNEAISPEEIQNIRQMVGDTIYIDERIESYIIRLVLSSRKDGEMMERYGLRELGEIVSYGSSPRGSQALKAAAKVHAFMEGRFYVLPEDVEAMAFDVLRHRLILTPGAEARGWTANDIIETILRRVPLP